ncbi:unnamed protein product, partial [Laminaria digitata]
GQVKSFPAQEAAGEGKAQHERRNEAKDSREGVNRSNRRSQGNCDQGKGCAEDSRDRGVEIGNSGVWEHVTGEEGTPTGGTIMKALIAGISVSIPVPAEAFCAWENRASPAKRTGNTNNAAATATSSARRDNATASPPGGG